MLLLNMNPVLAWLLGIMEYASELEIGGGTEVTKGTSAATLLPNWEAQQCAEALVAIEAWDSCEQGKPGGELPLVFVEGQGYIFTGFSVKFEKLLQPEHYYGGFVVTVVLTEVA